MRDDARDSIMEAVKAERARAHAMWGDEFDNKNTPNDWCAFVCRYAGEAIKMDRESKQFDVKRFKDNMAKVAGLAVAALEAVERTHGRLAKRHYDE